MKKKYDLNENAWRNMEFDNIAPIIMPNNKFKDDCGKYLSILWKISYFW